MTAPRYRIAHLDEIEPVPCPCGLSRRAFATSDNPVATLHQVDISTDARTHYHRRLTEIYLVLETEGDCFLELDGALHPVRPMTTALIKPGCRHRAVGRMKIVNVPGRRSVLVCSSGGQDACPHQQEGDGRSQEPAGDRRSGATIQTAGPSSFLLAFPGVAWTKRPEPPLQGYGSDRAWRGCDGINDGGHGIGVLSRSRIRWSQARDLRALSGISGAYNQSGGGGQDECMWRKRDRIT